MDTSKLSGFASISLEEMNGVSLLKRVDTKFLTSSSELSKLLPFLYSDYQILEIDGNRLMNYSTLYFDTKDLRCYMEHHNGKAKRHKIRIRRYVESDICFLEVKEKQNTRTPIYSILKSNRIRTVSFSKYCMGVSNIFTDIKSNKFKELNLKINQLNN